MEILEPRTRGYILFFNVDFAVVLWPLVVADVRVVRSEGPNELDLLGIHHLV